MPGPVDLTALSVDELIGLIKDQQRRFDAGEMDGQEALAAVRFVGRANAELRRRGLSELDIEWRLYDRPLA